MKNKQNESNKYECVLCETGEGNLHGSLCSKTQKLYTKEELSADLGWFEGLGVSEKESKDYIKFLLSKTASHELKL